MSELVQKLEGLVSPLLEEEGVELVDLTYQKQAGGMVLCFYLDQAEGINLNDCEKWSRKFSEFLDANDYIPNSYSLEVSSPGIYRPLKRLKDFVRFKGERIKVKLYSPLDGQKNFIGILVSADDNVIRVKLEDSKKEVDLPRSQVAKTHLDPLIEI